MNKVRIKAPRAIKHSNIALAWIVPPKIHVLKPYPTGGWYLEMETLGNN